LKVQRKKNLVLWTRGFIKCRGVESKKESKDTEKVLLTLPRWNI